MKKIILISFLLTLLFSCKEKAVDESLVLFNASPNNKEGKFILAEDVNDIIVGYTESTIESNSNNFEDLKFRGFEPDMFIYYSNDTKAADTTLVYENGKIIFSSRTAYKSLNNDQKSMDF